MYITRVSLRRVGHPIYQAFDRPWHVPLVVLRKVEISTPVISCVQFQGTMVELSVPRSVNLNLTEIFSEGSIIVNEDIDFLIGNYDDE